MKNFGRVYTPGKDHISLTVNGTAPFLSRWLDPNFPVSRWDMDDSWPPKATLKGEGPWPKENTNGFYESLPPLTLTFSPLKMDGWKITYLLGRPSFRGYVSFREGHWYELSYFSRLSNPKKTNIPQLLHVFSKSQFYGISGRPEPPLAPLVFFVPAPAMRKQGLLYLLLSQARQSRNAWRGHVAVVVPLFFWCVI